MSYQVIARKWRPQTFEEVTGQEAITRTLKNAIEHDRLHHAYLFSGARGVGKTTTARLLAKALNCHKSDKPTVTPCSFNDPTACASCKEIAEGNSIDVLEIDAASNTGVGNVRETIVEGIDIAPARDRFKVFIVDEVHMLSIAAFNALLKTLEEPPPRVAFIMATTELHKVPDTILSRCQQFEFRTIALNKIFERLKLIAEAEKINVSDAALREIARAGEGSMRDAQSAFDQVISFSGDKIETADVGAALGVAGSELLARVVEAVARQEAKTALEVVDELVSRGHDLRAFCRDLLTFLRDLLVAKVAGDAEHLLESANASVEDLNRYAADFSESDLTRFFHSLSDTESRLRLANQPRYLLEIGLVKLIEMRRVAGLEKVLERLARLEEAIENGGGNFPSGNSSGGKTAAAPETSKPSVPPLAPTQRASDSAAVAAPSPHISSFIPTARPPQSFAAAKTAMEKTASPTMDVETTGKSAPKIDAASANFRAALERELETRSLMPLLIALEKANSVRADGNVLEIEFSVNHKHNAGIVEKPENSKLIQEICRELTEQQFVVNVSISGSASEQQLSPEEAAEKRKKEELWKLAEADPAVQAALRVFRGKIIDVIPVDETENVQDAAA
jgi:DNA polymerase III subunit gamma/tau